MTGAHVGMCAYAHGMRGHVRVATCSREYGMQVTVIGEKVDRAGSLMVTQLRGTTYRPRARAHGHIRT